MSENNYVKLASVDVSKEMEKKQNLSYLSWAYAVDKLMRHDPQANWEFHPPEMYGETMMLKFDGKIDGIRENVVAMFSGLETYELRLSDVWFH